MVKEPEVSIMKISPSQAERWLENNDERNRFMRQRRVQKYTQDMKEGNWPLANQVIVFDSKGKLINGQHTLAAVLESGKTIDCIVLLNAPEKAKMVMDTSAQRTTGEHLRMNGLDFVAQADVTAKRLLLSHEFAYVRPVSDFEVVDIMKRHYALIEWAHHHFMSGGNTRGAGTVYVSIKNSSFRAIACRAALCGESKPRIEQFAEVLKTGLMDRGDEAAIKLRNYMLNPINVGCNSGVIERKHFYLLIESALRNFLDKEAPKSLRPVTKEIFPLNKEERDEPEIPKEELQP